MGLGRRTNGSGAPPVAGFSASMPHDSRPLFSELWERAIFIDDVPKLRAAAEAARKTGAFYSEFRVRHPDGSVHWIAGKGEVSTDETGQPRWLTGVCYEISDRKGLEARLLAVNETLEARVAEVREEARTLEILNQTGAVARQRIESGPRCSARDRCRGRVEWRAIRRLLLQCHGRERANPIRSMRSPAYLAKHSRNFPIRGIPRYSQPTFSGRGPGPVR